LKSTYIVPLARSLGKKNPQHWEKKNPQHWEKKIMKRKKFPQPLLHKLQRMGEIQILMVC